MRQIKATKDYEEIDVGTYELKFNSFEEITEDLKRKTDLIFSVITDGYYKLILRKVG